MTIENFFFFYNDAGVKINLNFAIIHVKFE